MEFSGRCRRLSSANASPAVQSERRKATIGTDVAPDSKGPSRVVQTVCAKLAGCRMSKTSAIAEISYSALSGRFRRVVYRRAGYFFEAFAVLKRYLLIFKEAIFDSKVER